MSKPLYDIELIERYFDNDVSESEKEVLLEAIEKDEKLKEMFEREKLLIKTIRFEGAQQDLAYLKSIEQSITKGERTSFPYYRYAIAAAVSLFIVAAVFLLMPKTSPEELFAQYYTPYDNIFEPTLRGGKTTDRASAFSAYERGDYQAAANLFEELLKQKREPGILLLLANAKLSLNKPEQAKVLLNELVESYDVLDVQANWYLALCHLKLGEKEPAQKILKRLVDDETSFAEKAKAILKNLD